jgi:hypothetical protein
MRFADDYVRSHLEHATLRYHYAELHVAYRPAEGGIEILAVGWPDVTGYMKDPSVKGGASVSRLEKPLKHETHPVTGDLLLRAEVDLHLRDSSGNWQKQTFRVDNGSDITAMSAALAAQLGLAMPQQGVRIAANTAIGQAVMEVRSGYLRMKVEGMDQTEYVIPCHFRGDPLAPPVFPSTFPRSLLGLSGVADKLRITTDGTPLSMAAPYGVVIIEEI